MKGFTDFPRTDAENLREEKPVFATALHVVFLGGVIGNS